jgi:hypothetical protein
MKSGEQHNLDMCGPNRQPSEQHGQSTLPCVWTQPACRRRWVRLDVDMAHINSTSMPTQHIRRISIGYKITPGMLLVLCLCALALGQPACFSSNEACAIALLYVKVIDQGIRTISEYLVVSSVRNMSFGVSSCEKPPSLVTLSARKAHSEALKTQVLPSNRTTLVTALPVKLQP